MLAKQGLGLTMIELEVAPTDTDADGIPDWWELAMFGDLTTAGPGTDFSGDGRTDLEAFLLGIDPRQPSLTRDLVSGHPKPPTSGHLKTAHSGEV